MRWFWIVSAIGFTAFHGLSVRGLGADWGQAISVALGCFACGVMFAQAAPSLAGIDTGRQQKDHHHDDQA